MSGAENCDVPLDNPDAATPTLDSDHRHDVRVDELEETADVIFEAHDQHQADINRLDGSPSESSFDETLGNQLDHQFDAETDAPRSRLTLHDACALLNQLDRRSRRAQPHVPTPAWSSESDDIRSINMAAEDDTASGALYDKRDDLPFLYQSTISDAHRILTRACLAFILSPLSKVGRLLSALASVFLLDSATGTSLLDDWVAACFSSPRFDANVAYLQMINSWGKNVNESSFANLLSIDLYADHVDGDRETPTNPFDLLTFIGLHVNPLDDGMATAFVLAPDIVPRYFDVYRTLAHWRYVDAMATRLWRQSRGIARCPQLWLFSRIVRCFFSALTSHVWHAVCAALRDFQAECSEGPTTWKSLYRLATEQDEFLGRAHAACLIGTSFAKSRRAMNGLVRLLMEVDYSAMHTSNPQVLCTFVTKRLRDFVDAAIQFIHHLENEARGGGEWVESLVGALRAALPKP